MDLHGTLRPLPLPTASTPVSLSLDQTRAGIHPAGETAWAPLQPAPLPPGLSGAKRKPSDALGRWTGGPIAGLVVAGTFRLLVEHGHFDIENFSIANRLFARLKVSMVPHELFEHEIDTLPDVDTSRGVGYEL